MVVWEYPLPGEKLWRFTNLDGETTLVVFDTNGDGRKEVGFAYYNQEDSAIHLVVVGSTEQSWAQKLWEYKHVLPRNVEVLDGMIHLGNLSGLEQEPSQLLFVVKQRVQTNKPGGNEKSIFWLLVRGWNRICFVAL